MNLETQKNQIKEPVTFIVATTQNDGVFANNFLRSPLFASGHTHEVIAMPGYHSAAAAYNAGMQAAKNDLMVFIHQDMYLPQFWLHDLERALDYLDCHDPSWGVLGCYGVEKNGRHRGYVYSSSQQFIGERLSCPVPVRTLDEIVLIFRKSSGLCFDERLPHFHFYGADVCLEAERRGKTNYVLPAFCLHNTDNYLILPREFYECYRHIKRKWRSVLPIHSSCISVTRWDANLYAMRANEWRLKLTRHAHLERYRLADIEAVWDSIQARVLSERTSNAGQTFGQGCCAAS